MPTFVQYFCRLASSEEKEKITQVESRVNSAADLKEAMAILRKNGIDYDSTAKPLAISYYQDNGNVNEIQVYPNPAQSELNIVFPKEEASNATILLLNTVGVEVKRSEFNAGSYEQTISVGELPRGLYYLNILDNSG